MYAENTVIDVRKKRSTGGSPFANIEEGKPKRVAIEFVLV